MSDLYHCTQSVHCGSSRLTSTVTVRWLRSNRLRGQHGWSIAVRRDIRITSTIVRRRSTDCVPSVRLSNPSVRARALTTWRFGERSRRTCRQLRCCYVRHLVGSTTVCPVEQLRACTGSLTARDCVRDHIIHVESDSYKRTNGFELFCSISQSVMTSPVVLTTEGAMLTVMSYSSSGRCVICADDGAGCSPYSSSDDPWSGMSSCCSSAFRGIRFNRRWCDRRCYLWVNWRLNSSHNHSTLKTLTNTH